MTLPLDVSDGQWYKVNWDGSGGRLTVAIGNPAITDSMEAGLVFHEDNMREDIHVYLGARPFSPGW